MLDHRENYNEPIEALRAALDGFQARLWTALPCILESYDPATGTASLQPAIQLKKTKADGTTEQVTLPLLTDCPVIFPQGGPFTLTFPLAQGDEVLGLFANRSIDPWFASGGIQPQGQFRMHSLSDGFCLAGVRSKVRLLTGVSTNSTQLRNEAGDTFVEVDASNNVNLKAAGKVTAIAVGDITAQAGGKATVTAVTEIDLTAPLVKITGNASVSGNMAVTGSVTSNAGVHNLGTHKHNVIGVQTGASTILSDTPTG